MVCRAFRVLFAGEVRHDPIQACVSAQLQSQIKDEAADILFHVVIATTRGHNLVPCFIQSFVGPRSHNVVFMYNVVFMFF